MNVLNVDAKCPACGKTIQVKYTPPRSAPPCSNPDSSAFSDSGDPSEVELPESCPHCLVKLAESDDFVDQVAAWCDENVKFPDPGPELEPDTTEDWVPHTDTEYALLASNYAELQRVRNGLHTDIAAICKTWAEANGSGQLDWNGSKTESLIKFLSNAMRRDAARIKLMDEALELIAGENMICRRLGYSESAELASKARKTQFKRVDEIQTMAVDIMTPFESHKPIC